ncbi:MAG: DsbA family protein [Caulobacteraceae bacterium]|nr:DsbA family protein [Caulobacteraceae bacterium]
MDRVKTSKTALGAALALALATAAGCSKSPQDVQFEAKVRNYLLEHPEVIQEAMQRLQDKQAQESLRLASEAIKQNRAAIEQDPRDFVANPGGRITVTEFYDYNCGHCKNIAPEVLKLIRENPDIRFVFKEFHIFDVPSSLRGARAALLARKSGRYLAVYEQLMAERAPIENAKVDAILRANGVDPSPLDNPMAMAQIDRQLQDIQALAAKLHIDGTPGFVIGDVLVPGEDLPGIRAAIDQARARAR